MLLQSRRHCTVHVAYSIALLHVGSILLSHRVPCPSGQQAIVGLARVATEHCHLRPSPQLFLSLSTVLSESSCVTSLGAQPNLVDEGLVLLLGVVGTAHLRAPLPLTPLLLCL
jgi:hypothetical protein